jgi:hypothetical protein
VFAVTCVGSLSQSPRNPEHLLIHRRSSTSVAREGARNSVSSCGRSGWIRVGVGLEADEGFELVDARLVGLRGDVAEGGRGPVGAGCVVDGMVGCVDQVQANLQGGRLVQS